MGSAGANAEEFSRSPIVGSTADSRLCRVASTVLDGVKRVTKEANPYKIGLMTRSENGRDNSEFFQRYRFCPVGVFLQTGGQFLRGCAACPNSSISNVQDRLAQADNQHDYQQ